MATAVCSTARPVERASLPGSLSSRRGNCLVATRQGRLPQQPAALPLLRQQRRAAVVAQAAAAPPAAAAAKAPTDIVYDAVIIGSGMGGLSTAAQMAAKGAKVVVLEK